MKVDDIFLAFILGVLLVISAIGSMSSIDAFLGILLGFTMGAILMVLFYHWIYEEEARTS